MDIYPSKARLFILGSLTRFWQIPALAVLLMGILAGRAAGETRIETDLSGPGWKLWLDKDAQWENDELFLPPVDPAKLPVNPPTGGWAALDGSGAVAVEVPGTVEEYLQDGKGPESDIKGVSWWSRTIRIPAASEPRRLILRFDSARHRAEVFVNRKLVGYDLIGNTPFEVDLTGAAQPGQECRLDVRVTDPGGNFDWRDSQPFQWGKYTFPMSHGFGGITGRVKLVECDPVYIDDLYLQNTPAVTTVNARLNIRNATGAEIRRTVTISVADKRNPAQQAFQQELKNAKLAPGDNPLEVKITVPDAKLWDLGHPNLYVCRASLEADGASREETDFAEKTFGFRWFAPEGIGQDAVFRLNGKRIVLRTAISWGFWPITGIYPKPEWAEKEIRTAKSLGQNMLNFHRCIGHPVSFEKADELGLLLFEEPGGYGSGVKTEFSRAIAREKLLRMVRRDRSHPSLVIFNMINEANEAAAKDPAILADRIKDIRDAHAIDPSRVITHTSAWAREPEGPAKMHMRPFDETVYMKGWYDFHRAGGPEVWKQELYKKPGDFYGWTDNKEEIVYMGEEGALSSPPRLELIKDALKDAPHLGWDGAVYLDWYRAFDDFLNRKNLRAAFPTVDTLTTSLGAISHGHQARKIENHRINNVTDGYAVNGWESMPFENHSGIVDEFRNPKADPAIMFLKNTPLYIAVKLRSQFVQLPGEVVADFYLVNERGWKGPRTMEVTVRNPRSEIISTKKIPVNITGGDTYGELLAEGVKLPITGAPGFYPWLFHIAASIPYSEPKKGDDSRPLALPAVGYDEVLAVDWKGVKLGGNGAVWEAGSRVADFLKTQKQLDPPAYRDDLKTLDWVIVAHPPSEGAPTAIPTDRLRDPSGQRQGLSTTFFRGSDLKEELHRRTDAGVDFSIEEGAQPDPAVPLTEGYSVRWEGQLLPTTSGAYGFAIRTNGGVVLKVNGVAVIDAAKNRDTQLLRGSTPLEADKAVPISVEFRQVRRDARCTLTWAAPEVGAPDPQRLIDRIRNDGGTLLVLDRADTWMDLIQKNTAVKFDGSFKIGLTWLGGSHFVKAHPLFKDLPVNQAMDWPYQAVVRDGRNRFALSAEGEELVAGAWHSTPMQLGTAVGIVPCGKGRIVFSTLDICENLANPSTAADVARKLLCNFIEYASGEPERK